MCHVAMLRPEQIETLEALPRIYRRQFEMLTDFIGTRNERGAQEAFQRVVTTARENGVRITEVVLPAPVTVDVEALSAAVPI
jgi:hypothetical protein